MIVTTFENIMPTLHYLFYLKKSKLYIKLEILWTTFVISLSFFV